MQEKSKKVFENSKDGTIGARIKVLLSKLNKNVMELEDMGGIGNATLKSWKDKPIDFSTNVVSSFKQKLKINNQWWETGKGEVFINDPSIDSTLENTTHDKQTDMDVKETFYRDLIENNDEYSILPRAVLKDYKIVPDKIIDVIIASNENEKKALEKSKDLEIVGLNERYERLIKGYENEIIDLTNQNEKLRNENNDLLRQISSKN